ncbi:MAG: hypothetical protein GC164_16220 [Phycisphaera sp.]|nr:hypothetical protein [Phycisphaera sp.]
MTRRAPRIPTAVWCLFAQCPWVLPLIPYRPYGLDMLTQVGGYVILGLSLLALVFLIRKKKLLACATLASVLVALLVHGFMYWPTIPHADGSEDPAYFDLRVVTYNAGGAAAGEWQRFARWAVDQDPDVVSVEEISWPWWEVNPFPDLPYRLTSRDGTAIYSRYKLSEIGDWQPRRRPDRSQVPYLHPALLEADAQKRCVFINVYLPSPRSVERWRASLEAVGQDEVALGVLRGTGVPMVAAGDFNSTPLGRVYRSFRENYGMVDACPDVLRSGTIPAWLPRCLALPIDHVMVSRGVRVVRYEVGPNTGSDHRPVFTVLRLPTVAVEPTGQEAHE